jgi:ATP-dependent protease ClpP protease subunit
MSYSDDDDNFVEPGVEYQMATQFIKNLNILSGRNPKRPILIHMKTNGGIRQEGMAIYDAILACPNPVTILGYTFAVSMSSIILQAADKRALMPHCLFLFHEGALSLNGTMKEVWTNADWTKKVEIPEMLSIYAGRLKQKGKYRHLPIERIKKILQGYMDKKEDVYLSAKEAVEWGFADEVFGADGVYDWTALRKF